MSDTLPSFDYPVFDSDHHCYEPREVFDEMPKSLKQHFRLVEVEGRTKLVVGGRISEFIPNPTFNVVAPPGAHESRYRRKNTKGKTASKTKAKSIPATPAMRNGRAHKELLDEQKLAGCLLFPTLASAVEIFLSYDADVVGGVAHAINEYLASDWGFGGDGRIYATPVISLVDVDKAVAELEWAIERGVRVVLVKPGPVPIDKGRASTSPGRPEFDPFWARINESGVLIGLHTSNSKYFDYYLDWAGNMGTSSEYKPFQKTQRDPLREVLNLNGRVTGDTCAALICHGVFERHPNVKVLSVENGSSWVSPMLDGLNRTYGHGPDAFSEDPVETFKKNFWVAPFYEDPMMELREMIGAKNILFGSDWPHPEGLAEPLTWAHELDGFTPEEVKQVMSSNIFGLLDSVKV